eukprot:1869709-Amphidinium_carterae.1
MHTCTPPPERKATHWTKLGGSNGDPAGALVPILNRGAHTCYAAGPSQAFNQSHSTASTSAPYSGPSCCRCRRTTNRRRSRTLESRCVGPLCRKADLPFLCCRPPGLPSPETHCAGRHLPTHAAQQSLLPGHGPCRTQF